MLHRQWLFPGSALLLLLPATSPAQQIRAEIRFGHRPVTAEVIVGHPRPYPAPAYHPHRRVIIEHAAPRVIVVQRFQRPHRGRGYWRHHGYRKVSVYYDRDHDCWYDRYDARYPGLREVRVYQRGGVYYDADNDRRDADWDRD